MTSLNDSDSAVTTQPTDRLVTLSHEDGNLTEFSKTCVRFWKSENWKVGTWNNRAV